MSLQPKPLVQRLKLKRKLSTSQPFRKLRAALLPTLWKSHLYVRSAHCWHLRALGFASLASPR